MLGIFYKSVVQAMLLFRSEMWVMTPCIGRTLGVFHHQVDQRFTGKQVRREAEGGRRYLPMNEVTE